MKLLFNNFNFLFDGFFRLGVLYVFSLKNENHFRMLVLEGWKLYDLLGNIKEKKTTKLLIFVYIVHSN